MNRKPATPEELLARMIEPWDDDVDIDIDLELERTLAMTPAEIRTDLEDMGYDVAALEREARDFLGAMGWRPQRRAQGRLLSVAAPILVLATLGGAFAPAVSNVLLPLAAHPPTDPPAVTAASPPPVFTDFEDGGTDHARPR